MNRVNYWDKLVSLSELKGKILTKIEVSHDEVRFYAETGEIYLMYHEQD